MQSLPLALPSVSRTMKRNKRQRGSHEEGQQKYFQNKSDISYLKTPLSTLGQPCVVASTLPLLLGIHLEVVTVVDYS